MDAEHAGHVARHTRVSAKDVGGGLDPVNAHDTAAGLRLISGYGRGDPRGGFGEPKTNGSHRRTHMVLDKTSMRGGGWMRRGRVWQHTEP
jgi:hypothetical protein